MNKLLNDYENYYFLADTHLNKNNMEITENFFQFLKKIVNVPNSCLIICGDFIDFWFENKFYDLSSEYPMLHDIKKFIKNNNYPIYLIKGNRDFVADKRFEKVSGIQILGEEILININKKKYYITHGDIFCTSDISYKLWRCFSRNFLVKYFSLLFYKNLAIFIITKLRSLSYIKKVRMNTFNLMININEVKKKAEKFDADFIICGHNHKLRFCKLKFNSKNVNLIVLHKLKKWGTYYLTIKQNAPFEIKTFIKNKVNI